MSRKIAALPMGLMIGKRAATARTAARKISATRRCASPKLFCVMGIFYKDALDHLLVRGVDGRGSANAPHLRDDLRLAHAIRSPNQPGRLEGRLHSGNCR